MPENSSNSGGAAGAVSNGAEKTNEKPEFHHSIPSSVPTKPSSPKVSYSDSGEDKPSDTLKRSVDEIKRLQEEISALRHDNLQLKEEALRLKRLVSARSGPGSSDPSSSSSNRTDSFTVQAMSPDATALS